METTYGTVTYRGQEIYLQQHAYISDSDETYEAHAKDGEGNDYRVYWDIIDGDNEDQGQACEWQEYRVVKE